jgi:hypothetical protein
MKRFLLALTALAASACSSDSVSDPIGDSRAAILTVVFESRPADTLLVLVSDSATIAKAESYVATRTGPRLISGRIVKGSGWDTRYPFHFQPESVQLVDLGIEVCDGAPMRTMQEVNSYFEWSTGNANSTSAQWCPWSSYPIAVQKISGA